MGAFAWLTSSDCVGLVAFAFCACATPLPIPAIASTARIIAAERLLIYLGLRNLASGFWQTN